MGLAIKLIIIIVTVIASTSSNELTNSTILQQHANKLFDQLQSTPMDAVLFWNSVTLQACANDYDKSISTTPDQRGPAATARAFAIIHGAMHDSLAVFHPTLQPVFKLNNIPSKGQVHQAPAIDATIMESAYRTLSFFYPKQQPLFDAVRKRYMEKIRKNLGDTVDVNTGVQFGRSVARQILKSRATDGSNITETYTPLAQSRYHTVDPLHPTQGYLGVHWGQVKPFALNSSSQYRPSNRVGNTSETRLDFLNSKEYAKQLNEIKLFGSKISPRRTKDLTDIGVAWAYDGVPKSGVPPRLYNQIVRNIATQQNNTLEDNARLFSLVNYALADAAIAAWESKYYFNLWRPIVGIRQAPNTAHRDPDWAPMGIPANGVGTSTTPAFPSYVSGHAAFGSALFEVLRRFYKTDYITFQFQSDEFCGTKIDSNTTRCRPGKPRSYKSFTQAETENSISRIYLGVHWRIDADEGQILGRKIGQHVFQKWG